MMMSAVNGGGSGCGLGGWLEVKRVPATGWIEVAVACAEMLGVAMHWASGRSVPCGGSECPLCPSFRLRNYGYLGVAVMGVDNRPYPCVLELPGAFVQHCGVDLRGGKAIGKVLRFYRKGAARRCQIVVEERGKTVLPLVSHVSSAEVFSSVAGVLGLEVRSSQLLGAKGGEEVFAGACAHKARTVFEELRPA